MSERFSRGGGRRSAAIGAALAAFGVIAIAGSSAQAASEGGPLTQSCREAAETLRGPCRGAEVLVAAGSATCRYAGTLPEEGCATPLGPPVSSAAIDAYERSWAHRALGLQFELAGDMPLRNAPWVGTHNSFNSTAEMGPTLSDTDANQQISLVDQLRLDVRSLELDVHWFASLSAGGRAPVVCHARPASELHAGCTIEKSLGVTLDEIAGWLREPANRDQVLVLYLEDHLEDAEGHAAGAGAIRESLGSLVYRPRGRPEDGCRRLPLAVSRVEVLASGAQVVIVSSCGPGDAWRDLVFDWSSPVSHVETRPRGYTDFPECASQDFGRAVYEATLVRYFEDSTGLTAGAATIGAASHDDGITAQTAGRMARCGVDLLGLDQLLPDDGRLEALVWSWARGEPRRRSGRCATQGAKGRWAARRCSERHPTACRAADGSWEVTKRAVRQRRAARACRAAGARHSVPRTGFEAQLLRAAMKTGGLRKAWLAYRRSPGGWTARDRRR